MDMDRIKEWGAFNACIYNNPWRGNFKLVRLLRTFWINGNNSNFKSAISDYLNVPENSAVCRFLIIWGMYGFCSESEDVKT